MYNQKYIDDLRNNAELNLMILEPAGIIERRVKSTKDLYSLRAFLKHLPCSDFTIRYLAQIILNDVVAKKRFRKVDCIKVLRAIYRNSEGKPYLNTDTIRFLFHIYKSLIFDISEQGQWKLSALIKDQILIDDEIQWLIENYERSTHLLNRLLLYPENHPIITEWAKEVYKTKRFPENRETEIIALLIKDDIPPNIDLSNNKLIIWAIFKARIYNTTKEILLQRYTNPDNYETLINLAIRLKMPTLIKFVIKKLNEEKADL